MKRKEFVVVSLAVEEMDTSYKERKVQNFKRHRRIVGVALNSV